MRNPASFSKVLGLDSNECVHYIDVKSVLRFKPPGDGNTSAFMREYTAGDLSKIPASQKLIEKCEDLAKETTKLHDRLREEQLINVSLRAELKLTQRELSRVVPRTVSAAIRTTRAGHHSSMVLKTLSDDAALFDASLASEMRACEVDGGDQWQLVHVLWRALVEARLCNK